MQQKLFLTRDETRHATCRRSASDGPTCTQNSGYYEMNEGNI